MIVGPLHPTWVLTWPIFHRAHMIWAISHIIIWSIQTIVYSIDYTKLTIESVDDEYGKEDYDYYNNDSGTQIKIGTSPRHSKSGINENPK